jgi:hypothetical protein
VAQPEEFAGHEDRNLIDTDPGRTERMQQHLQARRAQLRSGPREALQNLSDTDRQHLQALGYLEESDPRPAD